MGTNREIFEEKDEKIEQLERLLIELKEARQQSAATIAVGQNTRYVSEPKRISKSFIRAGVFKVILPILVLLIISVVIWQFAGGNTKKESVTFVESVQELATLATAEAHMKTVIKEKDNKIFGKDIPLDLPGTKRELLLVVPATVIAGVDLKKVTSEDMVINKETKEIDITLPHAKLIQDPAVQLDKIQAVDSNGLFRTDIKMDEGFEKAAEAQDKIRKEAISIGLLDTAEKNAEKALKVFFENIGYTVHVTFT
ncbi:hypothetical protein A8F94_14145 [Bacillus sp. FJAT-27225]|uniref:DUF4230 domain-containing protein n=1 Tax=Bacillus sp. FJAT-27225 TaxID=1743144 RepID=UPI00080C27E0|nr:DUF4230 domain-containing protein [Bacillus sp. FJAT-27225]OCA85983.1 hypothetical protein A8F94_14145 [Bacillus sp. FJAT-27225]